MVFDAYDLADPSRYLSQLLAHAHQLGASDVHLESTHGALRVRLRVDGLLHEQPGPAPAIGEAVLSRIKILANLDIAERRLPQDGELAGHTLGKPQCSYRISTLPTIYGENLVVRVLDTQVQNLALDALGLQPEQAQQLRQSLAEGHGLVMFTGPTGSGKTVSLYACLQSLNQSHLSLATIEDPTEIRLPGVTQVNIHERIGLTFAHALRAVLRQDPDVLMVGEIRDNDTANMAMRAAQTGHLVLSTLHTRDAPSAWLRLLHMGVPAYQVVSGVRLIVAQRLLRRLCPHCRVPLGQAHPHGQALGLDLSAQQQAFAPVGCARCHQGYRGRVGVFQLMPVTHALEQAVLQSASARQLRQEAQRQGVGTLREQARARVCEGLTSIDEALTQTPADDPP